MQKLQLLLLSALSVLNAVAQSPGTFVVTGTMTTRRLAHTTTLLQDGRVLVTGGYDGHASLASAELYDPSTGTFISTGAMATARAYHTATLLNDGRVLIAGDARDRSPSAELYDPSTGTFSPTGNMVTPSQHGHSATLLSNGKVFISRGTIIGAGGYLLPAAPEIYDPATGAFTQAGSANGTKQFSTATLLSGGKVLLAGGWNTGDASLYDPSTGSSTFLESLPIWTHTATLLTNGKVLITGGVFFTGSATYNDYGVDSLATSQIYDPSRGNLRNTGSLLEARDEHTATLLPGGQVLIAGGDWNYYRSLASAELYDPATASFTSTGAMNKSRDGLKATLLRDGTVLMTGGEHYFPYEVFDTAELYIPPLRAASAASLSGPLAPESLASLFGSRLALVTEEADPLSPLPTRLGGISLRVVDNAGAARLAPLLYVSPSQINFEVPAGTATGNVILEIVNAAAQQPQVAAQINNIAPALFAYQDNSPVAYALRFELGGKQTVLSIHDPIVLDDRPVYLILYATGIRNRSSVANVRCTTGGVSVPVDYAGPEGSGVLDLDQVNLRLTPNLKGFGVANLALTVDGIASNTVSVDIR